MPPRSFATTMYNTARRRTAGRRVSKFIRKSTSSLIRARRLAAYNVRQRFVRSFVNRRRYPQEIKPKRRSLRF